MVNTCTPQKEDKAITMPGAVIFGPTQGECANLYIQREPLARGNIQTRGGYRPSILRESSQDVRESARELLAPIHERSTSCHGFLEREYCLRFTSSAHPIRRVTLTFRDPRALSRERILRFDHRRVPQEAGRPGEHLAGPARGEDSPLRRSGPFRRLGAGTGEERSTNCRKNKCTEWDCAACARFSAI
jgi:hypothetical protein